MHVLRQPTASGYGQHDVHKQGEVASLAFPHVKLVLSDFFGAL
jgi:hypothetical protein